MIKILKNISEIKGVFIIKNIYIYIFSQHSENTHVEVFTTYLAQTHVRDMNMLRILKWLCFLL